VPVPGSDPHHGASGEFTNLPDPTKELVTASLMLRRAPSSAAADSGQQLLAGARNIPAASTLADPNDVAAVCSFAQHYGLTILDENFETRMVKVQGNAEQMNEAFGVRLCRATDSQGNQYLTYMGPISVPESISQCVTAVLGLDQRPVARRHSAF
jgi:kumamolisin